ncbi:unnamed protein product [Nesidiocoris tenuis]|uniref:Reverse transcriptase Ty1/copia-type domain-containing protein n=1 Tax=Nesidiocoris tenuis TaxID=355587 RepID=A0A6H5G2Y9_9HEMI|nr:unnamed protein product [Nesidiocoris tenuis]
MSLLGGQASPIIDHLQQGRSETISPLRLPELGHPRSVQDNFDRSTRQFSPPIFPKTCLGRPAHVFGPSSFYFLIKVRVAKQGFILLNSPPSHIKTNNEPIQQDHDLLTEDQQVTTEDQQETTEDQQEIFEDQQEEVDIQEIGTQQGSTTEARSTINDRPKRTIHPPKWHDDYEFVFLGAEDEPSKEDPSYWHDAIEAEIKSLIKNDTWEIVERTNQENIVGCRLVLKEKFNADGTLERKKARLVARGFT